jgi:hypothetical protein
MNGFLNFRSPNMFAGILGVFPLLVALIIFSSIVPALGQGSEIFECPENDYVFTGIPEQTLCEQYPNFNCETQIGAGTTFPKSSLIGSSITGNVCIVGDFEVDAPFRFYDAKVKITPGVKVSIKGNQDVQLSIPLEIDNSKLFACDGLWKGIELGFYAYISTHSHSEIEDAEKAIYSNVPSTLHIETTTFNRNRVGIELAEPHKSNALFGPLVWVFTNNRFTCDAPLNGTTNEITEAGVKLINSYLYTFQTGLNRFDDLKYGVYAVGDFSHIGASRFYMRRIKKDGIYMREGSINLDNSWFYNCEGIGINIGTAKLVNVKNTQFTISSTPSAEYRTGIYIDAFALNADVQINGISFSADMEGTNNRVRGIHLKGGNVGAGTKIRIGGNSLFTLRARRSQGIYLDGAFLSNSVTEIWGNRFRISNIAGQTGDRPQGILADNGEKNNLSIKWNTFTAYINNGLSQWGNGLELRNSRGENNEVKVNAFNDEVDNLLQYVIVAGFESTFFCSNNTSGFGGWSYEFNGLCFGTKYEGNTITGTGYGLVIRPGTFIGQQSHTGNKWYDIHFPGGSYGPVLHSWCESNPLFNKFLVHTQQSTCNNNPACFNPYHPQKIEPDVMDEFFGQQSGTPFEGCNDEFTGGGTDELDRQIAQGTFVPPADAPAMGWVSQRYLYHKLMNNPGFVSEHASFSTYLNSMANTSVGRFHDVHSVIEGALHAGADVDAPSRQALSGFNALMDSMADIDEAIEQHGPTEALIQNKKNLIIQIHGQHWAYDSLRTIYESQAEANLQDAYALNQTVPVTYDYEANEKAVNQIYLLSLMQQSGELSESQVAVLQAIAQQNPKQGGPAVHTALGLLPECARPEIQIEYNVQEQSYAVPIEERYMAGSGVAVKNGFDVSPNPARTSITVRILGETAGTLILTDITGKTWMQQPIEQQEMKIDISARIPAGIYLIQLRTAGGAFFAEKLIIQSN